MYFLTALGCALISGALWLIFKDRKNLHLEILAITYGAATLMWLIDCFFSLAEEGEFLSFTDPLDGWIAIATVIGGLFFWMILSFILNNRQKVIAESKE